ncbi:hypothetical protein F2P56_024711 [Juglans regia]|uniref:RNase H type-1 domain-containing protein n=2 Tax=Juglans regia TaxID=51240 RepID=A0A833UMT6_JUGRE|nr:uncharacterized protein LOC109014645 [Juglans regia]KAF5455100.1 hypothetical protein F2P56_024711 [Juglans regia]
MCLPVHEGGLGLRHLDDMQKALHMRFAWNLIQGKSLWAQFFKDKYVGSKPWALIDANKCTRFWKMIAKNISLVLENSKWWLREGNLCFWYDKWRDWGPLFSDLLVVGNPLLKVKDCQLSNSWDVDFLVSLVGHDHVNDILESLVVCKGGSGVLVWIKQDNGCFSTKSVWDCIRIRGSTINGHPWMWHSLFSLKILISMWKAWHNALSVDDHLRRIGVPIVGTIVGLLPSLLSWRLWHHRCVARMEGRLELFNLVWHSIVHEIHSICQGIHKVLKCFRHDSQILQSLFMSPLVPLRRSSRLFGAGGIIRDDHGNLLHAFAFPLGVGSNNRVELLALLYGLKACKALRIGYVDVEFDSLVVVSWWKQRRCGIWYLEDFWEENFGLLDSMVCSVCHVFREGNKATDWLAKHGSLGHHMEQHVIGEVPRLLRGLIRLDKLGIPSLCCR